MNHNGQPNIYNLDTNKEVRSKKGVAGAKTVNNSKAQENKSFQDRNEPCGQK